MPKPGSGHAYTATEHVLPLILMLTAFISSSLALTNTVLALAPYRPGLAVSASPRGLAYGFPRVLFRQLHTMGLLPVRMCRWALMDEYQVLFQWRTV